MSKPKILITNDDGINAPGIKSLWKALAPLGDVKVIAPATEQSACGLAITLRSPLKVDEVDWIGGTKAWCVTGTPSDCIKLGLSVILDEKPDIIVSGINRGSNAGGDVLSSGTVGGVITGALRGIQGIAFSCYDYHDTPFHLAEPYVPKIVDYILKHPLPQGTFLNVNFPPKLKERMKGLKLTRHGKGHWIESPEKRVHPQEGHSYYWLGSKALRFEEHEDSEILWLEDGYTTAVPVHIGELTDLEEVIARKMHFEGLV